MRYDFRNIDIVENNKKNRFKLKINKVSFLILYLTFLIIKLIYK
jgi:hypothetical protein